MKKLESIVRSVLYLAPLATSPDNEAFLQGVQSCVDLLDLVKSTSFVSASPRQRLRLAVRVVELFQLLFEMLASPNNRKSLIVKIELVKFCFRMLAFDPRTRNADPTIVADIKILPMSWPGQTNTQLVISDLLRTLAPVMVTVIRSRGDNLKAFVVYVTLNVVSLALLEDRVEFEARKRDLVSDLIWRRPLFDCTIEPPVDAFNRILKKIPIIRDLNYLDYYVSLNKRFFYYLEGATRTRN